MESGSLYFRRIDRFEDRIEGRASQAVWSLSAKPVQDWYRRNREHVFVCCLHLAEVESPKMWETYARNNGVMIRTNVASLREELSFPAPPPIAPYSAAMVAMAAQMGATLADADGTPVDGFTVGLVDYVDLAVGLVDYVDLATADVHELIKEGLSNTTPMFRKGKDDIDELEYRAILRPGSVTGETARKDGKYVVAMPVRLDRLIREIRFASVDDSGLRMNIEKLLAGAGLSLPVLPSSLGITMP